MNETSTTWLTPNVDGLYPAVDMAWYYTFKHIDGGRLPPLPAVDGSFGWLPPLGDGRLPIPLVLDGRVDPGGVARHVLRVAQVARAENLVLPETFVKFFGSARFATRIASAVDGYFEVGELERLPHDTSSPERLVRFFLDPQTYVWALWLGPEGRHRVVFASPDRAHDYGLTKITTCAPSFEQFIHRFWIEQTLAITLLRKEPVIDDVLRGYLESTGRVGP